MSRGLGKLQRHIIERAGMFSVNYSYLARWHYGSKPALHRAFDSLIDAGYLALSPYQYEGELPYYTLTSKGQMAYADIHKGEADSLKCRVQRAKPRGRVQRAVLEYVRRTDRDSDYVGVELSAVYRYVGAARPNISRALKGLQEKGLISREGDRLHVGGA